MSKKGILIIGAGGVSRVATVKCAMNIDTFEKITLASRTVSKCESIAADILKNQGVKIDVAWFVMRSPSNACGDVTSCTRWRSM